jgi:hypothetical protein
VEEAVHQLSNNSSWRTTFPINTPSQQIALGNGYYTWSLKDSDGSLSDDDSDSVKVVGIGTVGRATVAESVTLYPTGSALSCLEVAFHCQGNLTLGGSTVFTTNQTVSSNGNIAAGAFLASIQGNAEAVGTITGSISGSQTAGVTSRRMPGSSVFDYYLDNGTYIDINSLPLIDGARTIEKTLVAPTVNPYGSTNFEGIYVINCAGQRIRIRNSRILGTLVLLNPAASSSLEGSLRWDAAVANYPALLVQGTMEVRFSSADLSEADAAANFNPTGVPYLGTQDVDSLDVYPSEINGLVYYSGNMNTPQDFVESRFRGAVICESVSALSYCRFNYRSLLKEHPAPGFSSGNPMVISPGSRKRETLP